MNYKNLLFFLLMVLFPSCLEKLTFERPDSIKGAISIQGKLTKGNPSHVKVILRDVFDFFNTPRFLSASKVYLIDEGGNELQLTTKRQGFYNLDIPVDHPFFKVEYGNKYKIRVEGLKGTDYESEYDELFAAPIPDDFYVQETTIEYLDQFGAEQTFDQLNFYISTPIKLANTSTNSRLVWELDGISKISDTPYAGFCTTRGDPFGKPCYASYPPAKNHITFNGTKASGNRIDDFLINESNYTNLLAEGYYLVVHQQSVSEVAFNYWEQVGTVVNRTGDVFQAPAGAISSNLINLNDTKDKVYGLFYATEEHVLRVYVSPELGRNQMLQCPVAGLDGALAEYCCDCLRLDNSTTEKPEWWEED